MNETRDSFAIEHETPSEGKAGAFVALLRQAHDKLPLSEDYLVQLQTATVSNPGVKAAAFRTEQNWLGGAGRGAQSVTYLPPPPALVPELMHELMAFANDRAGAIDPIIAAGIVSFGFVFIHPFMDGNGRLSRFLFHQALCRSDQLPDGLVLPVSIAMKKNEREYLQVLQEYSRLARQRWNVTWLDADRYDFTYTGDPGFAMYRYWDATSCVEFGFRMAEMALQTELRQETRFIANYDAIATQINERFDLRGSDLSTLIVSCLDKNGVLSKRRRDQFASRVPEAVFAAIEDTTRRVLADTTDDHDGSGDNHKKPRGARIGKR